MSLFGGGWTHGAFAIPTHTPVGPGATSYLVLFRGVNGPARLRADTLEDAEAIAAEHPGARIVSVAPRGPGRSR